MSKKLTLLLVGVAASLALVASSMQGCGNSSSGGASDLAVCEQLCDKGLACNPDAGTAEMEAVTLCKQNCPSTVAASKACSNHAARFSAYKTCLAMDCAAYLGCLPTVPAASGCQGAGGSGGSTGSGGAGGSSGATCELCTRADNCCVARGGTTCNLATACNAVTGTQRQSVLTACQGVLTDGQMIPNPPAACAN